VQVMVLLPWRWNVSSISRDGNWEKTSGRTQAHADLSIVRRDSSPLPYATRGAQAPFSRRRERPIVKLMSTYVFVRARLNGGSRGCAKQALSEAFTR